MPWQSPLPQTRAPSVRLHRLNITIAVIIVSLSKIPRTPSLSLLYNQMASPNPTPYPFQFETAEHIETHNNGSSEDTTLLLKNVRGRIPSAQASRLRTMWLEAHRDPTKIIAHPCSYDALSSRLIEEAGFPMIFISGFAVAASHGLPDTGYIAMGEMSSRIQEIVRVTSVPIMVDGDTGYGSPMNVQRTVECFAAAGAAGVMIEDQTWPKSMLCRCAPLPSRCF